MLEQHGTSCSYRYADEIWRQARSAQTLAQTEVDTTSLEVDRATAARRRRRGRKDGDPHLDGEVLTAHLMLP